MSKVISVNSGSSSLKFQLFDMPSETVLTSGQAERIGQKMGVFTIKYNGEKKVTELPLPDHKAAVDILLKSLTELGIVESLEEIKGAGHRIVQGGAYFSESVVVDDDVVEKVDELCELACRTSDTYSYSIQHSIRQWDLRAIFSRYRMTGIHSSRSADTAHTAHPTGMSTDVQLN